MKSLFYHILFLFMVTGSLTSCYKDKGNYDIKPVDVIKIGGPAFSATNYSLEQFKILNIKPEFTFTGDPESLEYTWKLYPSSAKTNDPSIRIISNAKELDYEIKVPIGTYTILLELKDTKTGIVRSKTYGLTVRLKGGQGFLVLNDKENGVQDIDVILDNTKPEIVTGVFSASNTFQLKGAIGLTMLQSITNGAGLLYVFQKNGGYTLTSGFLHYQDAKNWFFDTPAQIAPTSISQDFGGTNTYLLNNGSIHSTYANSPPALFTFRASGNYNATHALFMGNMAFVYDNLNHRFLRFNKGAGEVNTIIKNVEDAFDTGNIGNKSCLLFDHNRQPGTAATVEYKPLAYCKDNDNGKVYVYKFAFFRSLAIYAESVKEVTAPGFATATAYVNASNNPLTYYAVGNKIYVYDFATDVAKEVYAFADANVSIDRLMTNGAQLLAVANSKTSNSGAVYFFRVQGTGMFEGNTHFSKYEGFGKIQDVEYKFISPNFGGINWK